MTYNYNNMLINDKNNIIDVLSGDTAVDNIRTSWFAYVRNTDFGAYNCMTNEFLYRYFDVSWSPTRFCIIICIDHIICQTYNFV